MHAAGPLLNADALHGRAVRRRRPERVRPSGGLPLPPGTHTRHAHARRLSPRAPQLILRQYYDLNYRLFTNVVLLKHKNSRAMVHYVAKSHAINVVVVGTPSPQEFLKALVEIFEIVVANRLRREQCPTKRLCPRCIQGAGIYSTVETSFGSCSAGHSLSLEDMKDGVLWEKRSWCRNSIWTSKVRYRALVVGASPSADLAPRSTRHSTRPAIGVWAIASSAPSSPQLTRTRPA